MTLLNCHFNQLVQEVYEVHMMKVNWNEIQANLA